MNYRPFGKSGQNVSEVGFGAWAIGGQQWGKVDDDQSIQALQAACDAGVTFFDTAQEYGSGHSETLIGRALRQHRPKLWYATKTGKYWDSHGKFHTDYRPEWFVWSIQGSLKRLQTDYIDLYQLHNPGEEVVRRPETWQALQKLRDQGKIRFYGASVSSLREGLDAINIGQVHALQFVYNIVNTRLAELIDQAHQAGVAVIVRTPFAYGALTGKYNLQSRFEPGDLRETWARNEFRRALQRAQDLRFLQRHGQTMAQAAIRFALAKTGVTVVIPGAKNPQQARDNAAASDARLTQEELDRIAQLQQQWTD